ncbi:MAG TPA: 7-cyano-7-deazaguanine synthase QueC [Acidimicrobiales bacterium]
MSGDGRPAVVLLSGGLDSTTCLAIAQAEGFSPVALSFRYGQRHTVELDCARRIAATAGVEHLVTDIDLAAFGGSALVDASLEIPKHDDVSELADEAAGGEIPITYVPARNTIFLSFALAVAEVRGATDVVIGVNAVDYSGYPDCRPEFVAAFEAMANLATRAAVEGRRLTIHTPLIEMTKADIIRRGIELGVDYGLTSTCYDPGADGGACGRCDACLLRARGFADAGIADPTRYTGG